jgi:Histidine kinase-, DNA gyrase B-, and HSP90-like ATPase
MSEDQLQFRLGLDAISSYKRLSYTAWHALAEFVDNSTQNGANFSSELEAAFKAEDDECLRVDIAYDRNAGLIRISDNAMGMDRGELDHAMIVGAPPTNTDGRSKYGLGMKTAACWLGNKWTVRTKKIGETVEIEVELDVQEIAGGKRGLPTRISEGHDPDAHYTVIEITDLNRPLHGRTLKKVKDFLASMYRKDLSEGSLDLRWQGEKLEWALPDSVFLRAKDNSLFKKDFNFEIPSEGSEPRPLKAVRGWVGVLDRGSRAKAGFSILHAERVVRGWPDSWRPPEIFGQIGGSNNLINQRLIGEIELDDFGVTHTKDDILWMDDEEAEVEKKLKEEAADYISTAKTRRKGDSEEGGPSEQEVQVAVEELESELSSGELADLVKVVEIPPESAVEESLRPLLEDANSSTPNFEAQVDQLEVRGFLDGDLSPNDPYIVVQSTQENLVLVVVNTRHPHFRQLEGIAGVLNYLRHCVYDAIAEWQARRSDSPLNSATVMILKDRLLRVAMSIEMREPEDTAP